MTAERPADVAALTEGERLSLAYAVTLHTGYPSPRGANDLSSVTTTVDDAVATILAARVAAARAEGYEAGRAEMTAAVEAEFGGECVRLRVGERQSCLDAKIVKSARCDPCRLRAILAAAPTLATVRADVGRDGAT